MRSLDTNLLLRLVLRDNAAVADYLEAFLASAKPGSFQVADAALFEMVWILAGPFYGYSRQDVAAALQQIVDISQINCNRALLFKVLPLYIKHPKLSFIDICLGVYAELNKAVPLLTFDKQLAKTLPNARLLTQDARVD